MVDVLIALLFAMFGTADLGDIDSAQLNAAMEDAGIERSVLDEYEQRTSIPGNGQDLLSPGSYAGTDGNPNPEGRD